MFATLKRTTGKWFYNFLEVSQFDFEVCESACPGLPT